MIEEKKGFVSIFMCIAVVIVIVGCSVIDRYISNDDEEAQEIAELIIKDYGP